MTAAGKTMAAMLLVSTTLGASAIVASPAMAQAARSYDIPAGELADVLNQFSRQAGVELAYRAELTAGISSPGLKGSYGPAEGLSRILAGTGITFRQTGPRGFTLNRAPQVSDNAVQLGPVRVEGEGVGSVSSDPTYALQNDGVAAQGYRSDSVSAIGPWEGRSLQDTPYSVTVVPRELIENAQATTPDQIYRLNPTTQLTRPQRQQDQSTAAIRGFPAGRAYNDGVPGDYFDHSTTTENIERVEVLNGLSGFIYGFSAVGGTINYVSKRPTAERLNRLTFGNNGGGNYYVHGDFGGPIDHDGRLGYRVNVVAQDGETVVNRQSIKKTYLSGAIDWHITDRLLLQVLASQRDYEPDGPAAWVFAAGVTRPSPKKLDSSVSWAQPWMDAYYRNTKYGAQLRWDASDALTMRTAWYQNENERGNPQAVNFIQPDGTYTQQIFNYFPPGSNGEDSRNRVGAGYLFADLAFDTGSIAHKLTLGIQRHQVVGDAYANVSAPIIYSGFSLDAPTYVPRPEVPPVDRGERNKYVDRVLHNFMIGDDITLSDHWSLLLGVAHSVFDDKLRGDKTSATTPTATLVFKPVPNLTTYVSYMKALEQGGVAATIFNGAPVVNAREVMSPLLSRQIEVGAKWSIGGMLLTAALFDIDKGLQYYDITDPAAPVYVQDGRQVHRGAEFTLIGKATEHLTLIGGLTLMDTEVKRQRQNPALEGKRPTAVAETLAKLRVEYQVPMLPALTLVGGMAYTGDSFADPLNTDRLSSYTLFDLGARYATTIARLPVTLRLEIQNVGDRRYWFNTNTIGDPRTVLFSVSTQL